MTGHTEIVGDNWKPRGESYDTTALFSKHETLTHLWVIRTVRHGRLVRVGCLCHEDPEAVTATRRHCRVAAAVQQVTYISMGILRCYGTRKREPGFDCSTLLTTYKDEISEVR